MDNNTETKRNHPSEHGEDSDPNLRDDSALQPGISSIKSNDYNKANNQLTETASDDFADPDFGKGADKTFDEKAHSHNE